MQRVLSGEAHCDESEATTALFYSITSTQVIPNHKRIMPCFFIRSSLQELLMLSTVSSQCSAKRISTDSYWNFLPRAAGSERHWARELSNKACHTFAATRNASNTGMQPFLAHLHMALPDHNPPYIATSYFLLIAIYLINKLHSSEVGI